MKRKATHSSVGIAFCSVALAAAAPASPQETIRGPGEFRNPDGLAVMRDARLQIREARREERSSWAMECEGGACVRIERRFWRDFHGCADAAAAYNGCNELTGEEAEEEGAPCRNYTCGPA